MSKLIAAEVLVWFPWLNAVKVVSQSSFPFVVLLLFVYIFLFLGGGGHIDDAQELLFVVLRIHMGW